jgi:response regulator NasT
VAQIVAALGHEVIAREIEVDEVGPVTARERPDVALVGLGESSQHALVLIEKIVQEAYCPVILLIHESNPGFVREASRRGIFAYITDGEAEDDPHEWQSSIDIVLRRFAEYHDLQGAFGRRAVIERAKGILMERHSVGEDGAFELLRSHARRHQPQARGRGDRRGRRPRAASEAGRLGLDLTGGAGRRSSAPGCGARRSSSRAPR